MTQPLTDACDAAEAELLIAPDELARRIESSDDLAMLPAVAMEAMDMANDPECSIDGFVSVIERDAGLVADFLSLSNSALYKTRCEIKGIQHAVAVVGFRQCQNLIISSSVKSLSKKLPPSVEWARDVLWRHGIQTATIARCLNSKLKLGFEGEEFSGAMIHDVGRLLIAAAAPDVFEVVDRLTFNEGDWVLENERQLIGTDHCEVGARFATAGELPAAMVEVIGCHHNPAQATSNQKLVSLISAADHMANHLMFMGSGQGYEPASNPGWDLLLSELPPGAAPNIDQLVQTSMKAAEEALNSVPATG